MGIGRIQMNRAIEKIIKHYMFHGRYPSFQTITHHLSGWLRSNTLGAPSFRPILARRKEASNHRAYNENINAIYTDLSDAYETTINQTKQSMADFEYVQTEREKLKYDLSLLDRDISRLLMIESNTDHKYFDGEIISFESAEHIDQANSSVSLDLKKRKASLKDMNHLSSKVKVDPSKAQFDTLMANSRTAALESLSRAFDNNKNTSWWEVVKTKTPGSIDGEDKKGMRAELTVLFEKQKTINEIRYLAHHGKPVYTKVEYTTNGSSFHPLPGKQNYREVTDLEVWEFSPINATGVKFIYEKKEHDDRSAGQYQFYFGAKDISFFQKAYETEGELFTKPIQFSGPVRMVSIEAEHDAPPSTSIDYEIAAYDPNKQVNDLSWHPISSMDENNPQYSQLIEFNTKHLRTAHIKKGEETREVINGMKVFRLIKDNGDPIISEILENAGTREDKETFETIQNAQLFRGINQWKREKTYSPFTGQIPLNYHWSNLIKQNPENIDIDFLPISNTLRLKGNESGKSDNLYRFTTCVYMEEAVTSPMSLALLQTLPTGIRKRLGTYSVYVNQSRQKTVHDEITMNLKRGWNEIVILYHWGDMQERKDLRDDYLPSETYLGKFNFHNQTKIRAELNPMTYLDTHQLFYNLSPNNREHFTIYERQVVLNYLPKDCLFQFKYEAGISDESLSNELLLKAKLKREDSNISVTPTIHEIKLRAR
ncbi:hypothetical protein [Virgibacillus salexigens]|uniref:F5/8 type C domain-containing protein n=1 Tax=Virgibacillus massiliensis TaxID=1462526 RepID=A0A024QHQ2_9BACI|nr:hypothetical protein [Virgibacillus massiliensis]CDQ41787.1 hypothetical protein BN990_04164 [Virgibacillus massiliensis]